MEEQYRTVTVTDKAERALRGGHPWVFGDEVLSLDAPAENGALVQVRSRKGRWLGMGFYNDHSKIRVRVLSRNANDRFDTDFWRRRLGYAIDYRAAVMGDAFSSNCRLVFGEADQLPGLTVDRFGDILVAQTLSLGMERRKELLFPLLAELLAQRGVPIRAIYERNDAALREKEGLSQGKGFFSAPGLADSADGHVLITENGLTYDVDYINGQKTGFFLDQKYNRRAVARIAGGSGCWTVSLTPAPSPSTPPRAGRPMSPPWTSPPMPSLWPGPTVPGTGWRIGWTLWWTMCSIC